MSAPASRLPTEPSAPVVSVPMSCPLIPAGSSIVLTRRLRLSGISPASNLRGFCYRHTPQVPPAAGNRFSDEPAMLCVAQVAMSLLRSQMRNQLINYCFGAASLRHFRNGKVNQGRQSLTLHLARDVADRLERRFEPIPPATLSVSLSRRAVGRKDQGPVSADPFFVSQLIRVEAQRSFGVLIARLHRPAQLAPPEQIAQLPLQIVTDIESWLIGPILLFVRGDQSDTSQLINLLCRSRRPILLHRLALTIAKADRLESFIRQLRVPILDRDPFATDVNAVIRFDRAHINHVLARDVLADLSAGVPTIHHHRVAVALLDRPINQLTGQGQFAREGDLPVGVITADTLENLAQIFALLTLLLLASQHFRAIFDAVLGDPLERLLDIHLIVPTQFQWIIDSPVGVVNRHHVVREAIAFGARDEPLSEQWKVLAVFLIVSIIHDQDRVLLGSRRRVFAQQFQATFVNRGSRPRVLGEKTIEAALVLDLNHERPIDRLNSFVLGNEQTCHVALTVFKLLRAAQTLLALCIFLNGRRYLNQGQHLTSFRFCDQKPIGSHSSSLGTAPQRRELPQKSSYLVATSLYQKAAEGARDKSVWGTSKFNQGALLREAGYGRAAAKSGCFRQNSRSLLLLMILKGRTPIVGDPILGSSCQVRQMLLNYEFPMKR